MTDDEMRCCVLGVACALESLANSEAGRERMLDVPDGLKLTIGLLRKQ